MATTPSFLRGHTQPQSPLPPAAAFSSQFLEHVAKQTTIKGVASHAPIGESWHVRLNSINSSKVIWFLSSDPNLTWENPLVPCMMVAFERTIGNSAQGSGWWTSSGTLSFMSMRPELARHYPFSYQPAEAFPSGHWLRKCQRRERAAKHYKAQFFISLW